MYLAGAGAVSGIDVSSSLSSPMSNGLVARRMQVCDLVALRVLSEVPTASQPSMPVSVATAATISAFHWVCLVLTAFLAADLVAALRAFLAMALGQTVTYTHAVLS